MSAYATVPKKPPPEVLETMTSADIDRLFKREPGWFDRDRVRKRLYAKGFPHHCERGRWSLLAVKKWLEGAGANPDNVPPDVEARPSRSTPRRRRGRAAASGYAPA